MYKSVWFQHTRSRSPRWNFPFHTGREICKVRSWTRVRVTRWMIFFFCENVLSVSVCLSVSQNAFQSHFYCFLKDIWILKSDCSLKSHPWEWFCVHTESEARCACTSTPDIYYNLFLCDAVWNLFVFLKWNHSLSHDLISEQTNSCETDITKKEMWYCLKLKKIHSWMEDTLTGQAGRGSRKDAA